MPDYKNKRLSVIGAGVSGQGLALLAKNLGFDVFVSEQKIINDNIKKLFTKNNIDFEENGNTEKVFDGACEILISSGISPKSEILIEAEKRGLKLTGELDFVLPHIKAKNLICVTGSNGKSTVTSLTGHILNRAGLKAGTGGNLGTASSTFTNEKENFDAVVLELSSFQLARAKNNLRSKISIVTNIAPDHIDWHGSFENYVEAKSKVLSLRDSEGWGIIQDRDFEILNASGKIITLSWNKIPEHDAQGHIFMNEEGQDAILILNGKSEKLFSFSDTTLIGAHNLENVAMSLCAAKLSGVNISDAKFLLEGFKPLPHRCEYAGTINGVQYIDDSKGTNVAATITAMTSIKGRKIIILGGQGKGEDYAPLAQAVEENCDYAVLIGEEAGKIQNALEKSGCKNFKRASNMEEAVDICESLAKPGMVVLLSPACTSWDMYKSYKARGEHFCRIVKEKSK
ncbi:MAG: UDP-N-acetylmuramoyl-L-alanine--D-glutamate ligase [Synergistaceae bacterium]|nr:UDP-N-acetylmuramoyl-L-alanine--D-glutamate ligase [Synergistaceae bacterium]